MATKNNSNAKSCTDEFRKFGVTMAIALAVFGGIFFWRQSDYYKYFFIISVLFLFPTLFMPTILGPVYKSWMALSAKIGWFMSRVILITLYYLVLTPIALLMRISGKTFLNTELSQDSSGSYWIPKENKGSEKRNYENQF
jgi:hypothetical protein